MSAHDELPDMGVVCDDCAVLTDNPIFGRVTIVEHCGICETDFCYDDSHVCDSRTETTARCSSCRDQQLCDSFGPADLEDIVEATIGAGAVA